MASRLNKYLEYQETFYKEIFNEQNYKPISDFRLMPNKNNAIIVSCIIISTISDFSISYWKPIHNSDEGDWICTNSNMEYIIVLTIDYGIPYEKNINIYDTCFDDFSMSPLRLEFAEKATKTNET